MSKITLSPVADLTQSTTAQTTINANSTTVQTAFDNTLSRDGTTPNQMGSTLDMNSNQIINLPNPATATSPARLQDLQTLNGGGTVTNIPSGGTSGQVLSKNSNSNYDVHWSTAGTGTATSVGLAMPADFTVTNTPVTISGTLTAAYATTPTGTGAFVKTSAPTIANPTITGSLTATNLVTNADLAQSAAYTIKGNALGSTATPTDISIPALTQKVAPASTDFVLISDQAASSALKYATVGSIAAGGGISTFNSLTGAVTTSVVVRPFTSSGTYTPTAGMLHCIIECVGGGGGGGGAAAAGAGLFNGAGGGGGGGYARKFMTGAGIGPSQVVTIGAAGAGATAGNNPGGAGGTTSVGSICVATGGSGGTGVVNQAGSAGGAAGTGSTGDLLIPGKNGGNGFPGTSSSFTTATGAGGDAAFGFGYGIPSQSANVNGSAGQGYGAGGSGASDYNSTGNHSGGAGTAGIVIITEYVNL